MKVLNFFIIKLFAIFSRLPIIVNLNAEDLLEECNKALSTTLMSMSNKGASTQIQVGNSSQTEKAVAENIMAVYEAICTRFPGKFANIRGLNLRFGNSSWTVPIYISYGKFLVISFRIR